MTLQYLLRKVKDEKPNSFSDERLIGFVNEIEVEVAEQLRIEAADIPVYENTAESLAKKLLAPAPYDRLYASYLKAMIDYANEEYESYQNNQAQHVQDFRDFTDFVVRQNQAVSSTIPKRFVNVF